MSLQSPRPFNVTWTTGSTFSKGVDMGGAFLYVTIEIPGSINTGFSVASTPFYIQASGDGVTYRRYMEPLTSTVSNDFTIASSVSNRMIGVPYLGNRYIMLEVSGTCTTPVSGFRVIASDSL